MMLVEAERSFPQQRAKCAYLKQSDRYNKFFHDMVKRNNKRNSIVALVKESGEHMTSSRKSGQQYTQLGIDPHSYTTTGFAVW